MDEKKEDVELGKLPVVEFGIGKVVNDAQLKCTFFKSNRAESAKRKLVCESSHLSYMGTNFDYNPSRQYTKQYIALINKKNGQKHFFDADVYKLYPKMNRDGDVDSEEERQEAMKKVQNETRSFLERQDSLTEVFGSNKRQKSMVLRQRNKVSDSTEAVKSVVQELIMEEGIAEGQMAGEQTISFLPYDKEAATADSVYSMDKYVPLSLRSSVSEAAKELLNPSAKMIKEWKEKKDPRGSRYISWHATRPHPSVKNDEDTHAEYVNCLQILAYYIKLYCPTGTFPEKDAYIKQMNKNVVEWLRNEFTPDEKKFLLKSRLPARVKDKILGYAIILAWHIDSCQTDIKMLSEGFNITERKLSMVVRALGGQIKSSKSGGLTTTMGVLKLPLDFPKPSKRAR